MTNNPDNWLKYRREAIFDSRLYPIFEGIRDYHDEYFDMPFGELVDFCDEKMLEWYWQKDWLLEFGQYLINSFISNNSQARKFRQSWPEAYHQCQELSDQIILDQTLASLNDSELKRLLSHWNELNKRAHCLCEGSIDALDETLGGELREELTKAQTADINSIFAALSTPDEASFLQKRDLEIANLAHSDKVRKDQISEIAKKYWWTTLGWMPQPILDAADVKAAIKSVMRPEQQIETRPAEKKSLLEKFSKQSRLVALAKLFADLALWHDQRKEFQVRMIAAGDAILVEISRRRQDLSVDDLMRLNYHEVVDYINEKDLEKVLAKRKQFYFRYLKKDKLSAFDGAAAVEKKDELIVKSETQRLTEFRGMPASAGSVRAIARVSNDPKYLAKFLKAGEILVTGQTMPDFVPAMKRASAVVTDEGGATCHAAIISRELKIPCVVGTKIATDVLKTGDLIEVDANRGIIKIIKPTGEKR